MKKLMLIGILVVSMVIVLVGCSTKDKPAEVKDNEVIREVGTEDKEVIANNDITSTADGTLEEGEKVDVKSDLDKVTDEKVDEDKVAEDKMTEKQLTVGMFIPNGNYKVKYDASDLVSSENIIKGDGTSYQVIGTSGKGPKIDVYSIKYSDLYKVYSGDLSEEQMKDVAGINYLAEKENLEELLIFKGPIKVGTRWDNKEIVEVGENLKLGDLTLEGSYVKTWEKEVKDEKEIIKICYYSEGLGCVKYKVTIDGSEIESSTLTSVIKE